MAGTPHDGGASRVVVGPGRAVRSAPGTTRLEYPITLGADAAHTLWFEVPDWCAAGPTRGDAALLAALLPAMRTGRDLEVRGTVSKRLIDNLLDLMGAVSMWFPDFSRISILAEEVDEDPLDHDRRPTGLFFSGGVDSFHSLLTSARPIDHLLHVENLDVQNPDPRLAARISAMLDDVAERTSTGLVRVRTNIRGLLDPFSRWTLHAHAVALGAVGHAVAGGIGTIVIAADRTYADLKPYGIHPGTTHLYGSNRLASQSHGWGTTRVDKVAALADWDVAMDHLRVCWRNPAGAYNCGECEKCIRTLVALELADATGRCATMGDLPDLGTIASNELDSQDVLDYAIPALARARSQPHRRDLADALQQSIDRGRERLAADRLDADWPLAAAGDVSDFVGRHRESLYQALSAYQGRWLVGQVLRSLPRRFARKLRRETHRR